MLMWYLGPLKLQVHVPAAIIVIQVVNLFELLRP